MNPDIVIAAAAVGVPILTATWAVIRWGNRVNNLLERHDQRLNDHAEIIERRKLYREQRGIPA